MNNDDRINLIRRVSEIEGLTDHERSALLGLLRENKTYGLVWENKKEDVEDKMQEKLPVLKEVPKRAIISDSKDAPNHILIEGDNLEALTTLAYTHAGRIDVIYIDPPYNTGNKDFVYNDKFINLDDEYKHSMWLSFMSRRLRIAKQLLSDKGVIFISIDDNEQAQLKLLCDEVFGDKNFVGMISRATGTTTGQDTGSLGKACDYMLVFSKQENYMINGLPLDEKDLERYSMSDERGNFSILQLRRTGGEDRREDRPTMFFPIIAPDGTEVYPYGPTGYESRWRVSPQKAKQMKAENLLYFKKDKNNEWKVYYKFYSKNKTKRPSNLWIDIEGNKKAQIELKNVLHDKLFETPKPIDLIRRILQITNSSSSTILDFFAGSGTTLHATMQLNGEDGGHRQCILVTNNENDICEKVTYERNKRVIQGYTTPKGEQVAGLTNNTLRYYKTGFVSREPNNANKRELVAAATELLCIKNDVYQEQSVFCGRRLKPTAARYFDDGRTQMLIIYNELTVKAFVKAIGGMEVGGRIKVYVFSNNSYAYADDFEPVADKVEVCALPAAIYDAYKKVLPPRKRSGKPADNEPFARMRQDEEKQAEFNFKEEGGEA